MHASRTNPLNLRTSGNLLGFGAIHIHVLPLGRITARNQTNLCGCAYLCYISEIWLRLLNFDKIQKHNFQVGPTRNLVQQKVQPNHSRSTLPYQSHKTNHGPGLPGHLAIVSSPRPPTPACKTSFYRPGLHSRSKSNHRSPDWFQRPR